MVKESDYQPENGWFVSCWGHFDSSSCVKERSDLGGLCPDSAVLRVKVQTGSVSGSDTAVL